MNDVAVHILTRPDPRYPRWIDDPGDRRSAVWGATQNTVGFWAEGKPWPQHDYTLANWPATAELSPPECSSPQVTTDPSARIAENAPWLA